MEIDRGVGGLSGQWQSVGTMDLFRGDGDVERRRAFAREKEVFWNDGVMLG